MFLPYQIPEDFTERIAKTIDDCILDAMAKGIDLHEMGIRQWFTTDDQNIITFHCKAFKKEDMYDATPNNKSK